MAQTLFDLALLLAVLSHARRGWRSGGVRSILAMTGALLGGWLALVRLPALLDRLPDGGSPLMTSVLLLAGTVTAAALGEAVAGSLAARIAPPVRHSGSGRLDGLLGAVAQSLVLCLIITTLGSAVRPLLPTIWSQTLNSSRVLPAMDAVVPDQAERWASRVTRRLGELGLPGAFSGLNREPVLPIAPPDAAAAKAPAVVRASASIVKVRADALTCDQQHEGSGWVVAPHRIVTNAHVVAGATRTRVQVGGEGARLDATVVAFDPDLDLAILDVPELRAAPLPVAGPLPVGSDVVVAGFPLDGGFTVRAARVRGTITAGGDDIYDRRPTRREVYSVAGTVQPGNSGGPLLTTDGKVAGTVFARSVVDTQTGYVLTNRATAALREKAASLVTPVSTQACSRT